MVDKRYVVGIISVAVIVSVISVVLVMQPEPDQPIPITTEPDKIRVFASFFPYYEFTKNVAGDHAIVEQYIPVGTESHDWEPRAKEIILLDNTDVFVYNGLGIDAYVSDIIKSGEFDNILFVNASKGVSLLAIEEEEEEEEEEDHHEGSYDPHIWLDPILVKQQVNNIRDGLALADPDNESYFFQNAADYNAKLDLLDEQIRNSLARCQQDTIVPFHNAFAYLGEQYDLKIVPLSGLSPDTEASAAEIAEFVNFVQDNDIKVIFSEELIDPRLAETIAEEAGVKTLVLSPIEGLTPEEEVKELSYIEKMEKNIISLRTALECQ